MKFVWKVNQDQDQYQDRGLYTRRADEEAQGQEGDCLDLKTAITAIDQSYDTTWQSSRHIDEVRHMADKHYKRRKIIDALLVAYASRSVRLLLELLAPDFEHRTLPESLGFPLRDRAAFADHAKEVFAIFACFEMMPQAIIDDLSTNTIVIHAHMRGVFINRDGGNNNKDDDDNEEKGKGGEGEGLKVWTNECVLLITLNDTNDRIVEIKEFVDSAKAKEMASKHAPEVFGDGDVSAGGGSVAKSTTTSTNTGTSASTQTDLATGTSTSVDSRTTSVTHTNPAPGPAHGIHLEPARDRDTRPTAITQTTSDKNTSTSPVPVHGIRVIPVRGSTAHRRRSGQTNKGTYTSIDTYTYMDKYSGTEDPLYDMYNYLPHMVRTWRFIYGYRNSRIAMASLAVLILALCAHTYLELVEAYHMLRESIRPYPLREFF